MPARTPRPEASRLRPDRRALLRALPAATLLGGCATLPSWARETGQVRIAKVEAFAVRSAIFVKVTGDDGSAGWGEAGHSGEEHVAALVNGVIDDLVRGMDVFAAEPVWARMFYELDEYGPGGLASQALAGVDCALWDLRGRLLQQPVHALLGGAFRTRFPVYGSFSRSAGDGKYHSDAHMAETAVQLVSEGFRVLKVRLAIREENADPQEDPAFSTVGAVRKAVGDGIELYVDANNGYRPARAIRVGRRLAEEFGVTVFEEPVAAYHYASMAQVSDALDIDIAAGEHEYTRWAFRDLILQGKPDVLNPDVSKLCGLTDALKVNALAEVFDLPIAVHNARPTLLSAAHAHYVAASQNATRHQEHPGRNRLAHLWEFFEERIEAKDGHVSVPPGPGLGLTPREDVIRKAAGA
jgi:L-alanine-DL-glutamate epimerase-like enolase superfamily enzyme